MIYSLKLYGMFISLMVTIMLICDALAFKVVSIHGYNFAASGLIFPFSFLLACIATEVYGYKLAARIIWLQLMCQAVFILIVNFFVILSIHTSTDIASPYFHLYRNFWHVLIASSASIPFAYFAADFIMSKTKIKMYGKFFFIRYFLSSAVGKGILVFIAYPINFYGQLNTLQILHIALNTLAYKIVMALLIIPIALLLTILVKKIEKLDFYDYGISYNPFSAFDLTQHGKNLYQMKKVIGG
jgi:uncharacterized PurR-regulated membrane protein YhhQ (DUF165 family)